MLVLTRPKASVPSLDAQKNAGKGASSVSGLAGNTSPGLRVSIGCLGWRAEARRMTEKALSEEKETLMRFEVRRSVKSVDPLHLSRGFL